MVRYKSIFTVLLVMSLAMFMCAFTCNNSPAAKASLGASAAGVQLQNVEVNLHNAGKIDDQEHKVIQNGFLVLGEAGQQMDKCIGAGGGATCVDAAIQAAKSFEQSAISPVKNTDSKQQLEAAIQALELSFNTLKGAL